MLKKLTGRLRPTFFRIDNIVIFTFMEIDNLLIAQMCQLQLDIKFNKEDETNRLQYEQKELIDDYFNFNF